MLGGSCNFSVVYVRYVKNITLILILRGLHVVDALVSTSFFLSLCMFYAGLAVSLGTQAAQRLSQ